MGPNWKTSSPVYTNLTHKVESNNIFTTINNSLDKHSPEPESMDKIEPSKIKDPEHDLCELKFLRSREAYHTAKGYIQDMNGTNTTKLIMILKILHLKSSLVIS